MYDIAIIGAGPAGSTLARYLGTGMKVLLIDRRSFNKENTEMGKSYEKCCGGLIAPDAQHMLAKMGLGIPKDVLVGPQLFTVRAIDMQNNMEKYYQRHYINVDREKFDLWLTTLVPKDVDTRWGCLFKGFERKDNHVEFSFWENGVLQKEQARILIGADGAASKVRRMAFPELPLPKLYVSIQEWFRVKDSLPYFSSIFDNEISDFYAWTIPKEDLLIVGAAIPLGEDANVRFELLLHKLERYGMTLDEKVARSGAFILRPNNAAGIYTGNGNIGLVGEAAGWISPSSAEGMSYAFRSAYALAQAIWENPKDFHPAYKRNTTSLRNNILVKSIKSPFMYQPLIRKLVMTTGVLSMRPYE